MLRELRPRVLHTVGAPLGSVAKGLVSMGVVKNRASRSQKAWAYLHPLSVIMDKSLIIMAIPHGVVIRVK